MNTPALKVCPIGRQWSHFVTVDGPEIANRLINRRSCARRSMSHCTSAVLLPSQTARPLGVVLRLLANRGFGSEEDKYGRRPQPDA